MKGITVIEFLLMLAIGAVIGTITWMTWVGAGHKANVWNRCHPSVPVTRTEAWFINDMQLDECDVGGEDAIRIPSD
jgi:hypothetical protein